MSFSLGNYLGNRGFNPFIPKESLGALKKLVHNPESSLLSKNLRNSRQWKQYGRPASKIAAGVAIAGLTGGIGTPLLFSPAGMAAGLANGLINDTNSGAFQPIQNIVVPAATGYAAGHSTAGKAFDNSMAGTAPATASQNAAAANPSAMGVDLQPAQVVPQSDLASVGMPSAQATQAPTMAGRVYNAGGAAVNANGGVANTALDLAKTFGAALIPQPQYAQQQNGQIAALSQAISPKGGTTNNIQNRQLY